MEEQGNKDNPSGHYVAAQIRKLDEKPKRTSEQTVWWVSRLHEWFTTYCRYPLEFKLLFHHPQIPYHLTISDPNTSVSLTALPPHFYPLLTLSILSSTNPTKTHRHGISIILWCRGNQLSKECSIDTGPKSIHSN